MRPGELLNHLADAIAKVSAFDAECSFPTNDALGEELSVGQLKEIRLNVSAEIAKALEQACPHDMGTVTTHDTGSMSVCAWRPSMVHCAACWKVMP